MQTFAWTAGFSEAAGDGAGVADASTAAAVVLRTPPGFPKRPGQQINQLFFMTRILSCVTN